MAWEQQPSRCVQTQPARMSWTQPARMRSRPSIQVGKGPTWQKPSTWRARVLLYVWPPADLRRAAAGGQTWLHLLNRTRHFLCPCLHATSPAPHHALLHHTLFSRRHELLHFHEILQMANVCHFHSDRRIPNSDTIPVPVEHPAEAGTKKVISRR